MLQYMGIKIAVWVNFILWHIFKGTRILISYFITG